MPRSTSSSYFAVCENIFFCKGGTDIISWRIIVDRGRTDRITEVLEVAEPSYIFSSGGSEESDGVEGKRGASMCKRKIYDEDIEFKSKMMSCRVGMYFSPMLMPPQGVQHVQMAAWPHMGLGMGMNMGMGMSATTGMSDMHMAMAMAAMAAAAPREFSPMMTFRGAVIPAIQTTASSALDSASLTHGVSGQVIPSPPSQMISQQQQLVQVYKPALL